MYGKQQRTMLSGIGPMPINPGPDLVCRMAARSFAQVKPRSMLICLSGNEEPHDTDSP
ncbi:hypothetical protein GUITHDRAFT_149710 [Guillardia theta CCMP2712]|uniref:Uncharacterized protein n=1 Tax=Guillardia theta (strain CCMP2712) TaxID=905079 RepID=L1K3T7_GUITC|nr:hypothetical protein GUITHDRAFT_149710 [Guillardia theta CCMP2712]EKX55135.1 hypothetical protein GUITHDRAFT_149710 [Guillardia theta CCMP2712]|eukprot:XP_005842115.1 hypothetical protein GUITHDRAFT_149710 [Guillardia theta CCMP2712]